MPVIDAGTDGVVPYLVLAYIEGHDLATEVARRGAFPPPEAVSLALALLSALGAAHAAGIVHRDVKPGNVMLRASDGVPLLADFGLARAGTREGIHTKTGVILGTPLYLAPERIQSDVVAPSSDLYSVGCVLYECLSGKPPLDGETVFEVVDAQLNRVPEPLDLVVKGLPRELAAVVERALEKEPERRFADAASLARALEQALVDAARAGARSRPSGTMTLPRSRPTAPVGSGAPSSTARLSQRTAALPEQPDPARPVLPGARPKAPRFAVAAAVLIAVAAAAVRLGSRPVALTPSPTFSPEAVAAPGNASAAERALALATALDQVDVEHVIHDLLSPHDPPVFDLEVSYLDETAAVGFKPIQPQWRPWQTADRGASILREPVRKLYPELAWLRRDGRRLMAPGGLPSAVQRRLYGAVSRLEPLDLPLRGSRSDQRAFGWAHLVEPAVTLHAAKLAHAPAALSHDPAVRRIRPLTWFVLPDKLVMGFLSGWARTCPEAAELLGIPGAPPERIVKELVAQAHQQPVESPLPPLTAAERAGRVRLRVTVAQLCPAHYIEITFGDEDPLVVHIQQIGDRDVRLAMDGYDLPPDFEPLTMNSGTEKVVGLVWATWEIELPGAWLPDKSASGVKIALRMPPGATPVTISRLHRGAILGAVDLLVGPAEMPHLEPVPASEAGPAAPLFDRFDAMTEPACGARAQADYRAAWQAARAALTGPAKKRVDGALEALCRVPGMADRSWLAHALRADIAATPKWNPLCAALRESALDRYVAEYLNDLPDDATGPAELEVWYGLLIDAFRHAAGAHPAATLRCRQREDAVRGRYPDQAAKLSPEMFREWAASPK